jgi:hypothetical protein
VAVNLEELTDKILRSAHLLLLAVVDQPANLELVVTQVLLEDQVVVVYVPAATVAQPLKVSNLVNQAHLVMDLPADNQQLW